MTQQQKQLKEKALLQALRHNFTLVRKKNTVYKMFKDGSTKILSTSSDPKDVWGDALAELKPGKTKKPENEEACNEPGCIKVFADGGSRGNPGPSASGYVILDHEDNILEEGGEYLGITTNNQAEYQAVKLALENVHKFSPNHVEVYLDSMLVVNQLNGVFKVKSKDLWPVHQDIQKIKEEIASIRITHVRREFNTLADAQVNIILDSHENGA